ncbi:MAG: universal stress protein [Burkholderiales bacterium]|nr:universal stress protein [Burkholderiales bacterium]MCC7115626.1 universal stress protein [Burkholderiales bacterium]
MYKHILLPTDGSPASERAAKAGVELARALGARVTAFFAAPAPTPVVYRGVVPVRLISPARHAKVVEQTAARLLGGVEALAKAAGVRCESIHVTSDFPADAIVEVAKRRKCDLIFMGSHGRRGFSGLILGSQTQRVLMQTKIPVVVYRDRPAGRP